MTQTGDIRRPAACVASPGMTNKKNEVPRRDPIMTYAELRDIYVGDVERQAAEDVEQGLCLPRDAKLRVGIAETAFTYMIDVAVRERISFVSRAGVVGLMPDDWRTDDAPMEEKVANWHAVTAARLLSPADRAAAKVTSMTRDE